MTVFGKKRDARVVEFVDGPILRADGEFLLVRRCANGGEWVKLHIHESQGSFVGRESRRWWCLVGGILCVRLTDRVGRSGLFRYVWS